MILERKTTRAPFLFLALIVVSLVFSRRAAAVEQKEIAQRGGGCLSCHEEIEIINAKMAKAWGADKKCEICHLGRPAAASKFEAHDGLIANPGDLRVINRTCGKCHSDYGEISILTVKGVDNHVGRVMRSLMATAAGEIAGTRYLWGEQPMRSASYGVRAVVDLDRERPPGAVEALRRLLPSTHSDADSLLRGACLRCHLWTEDKTTPGVFRPAGCSACHVPYAADGLSQSADRAVSKKESGHPETHTITTKVLDRQCLLCHNDGGARIGLSYTGLAVADPSLGRSDAEPVGLAAYGTSLVHVRPDVHFRRGMACIDCHDSVDLHGDGNIYSHQEDQVGIRCESCHGNSSEPPTFRTERGHELAAVQTNEKEPYLRTKIHNDKLVIPVLHSKGESGAEPADIWHKGHDRLECYACHSKRVRQCYVCHMTRDDGESSPIDWALGMGEGQPPKPSSGSWTGRKLMQQWDEPVLGLNQKDRISPMMPGGQAVLRHLDDQGNELEPDHTFSTSAGLYGFSMNPVQPHSISADSRSCASCHSSRKALGLGGDLIDLKRLGLPLSFSPDRIVDEDGVRIQDSAHEGARPFSREELTGLLRTGACIICHEGTPGPEHDELPGPPASLRGADGRHHESMRKIVESEQD